MRGAVSAHALGISVDVWQQIHGGAAGFCYNPRVRLYIMVHHLKCNDSTRVLSDRLSSLRKAIMTQSHGMRLKCEGLS